MCIIYLLLNFKSKLTSSLLIFTGISIDLTATGSNVGGNLGTVVNDGNFSQSSDDNAIEFQATMRAVDAVLQNTNGKTLPVVSSTSVNGFNQPSSSMLLKVRTSVLLVPNYVWESPNHTNVSITFGVMH